MCPYSVTCLSKEILWAVKFIHTDSVLHISKRGSWSPPVLLMSHQREWFTKPPIKSYLWSPSASPECNWPWKCITIAAGKEQTLSGKDGLERVMLGLFFFFRSMELEKDEMKSWAKAEVMTTQCVYNTPWQWMEKCSHSTPLSTHIPLSSCILTSHDHLPFLSLTPSILTFKKIPTWH